VRKVVVTAELRRRVEGDRRFRAAVQAADCTDGTWRETASCTTATDPDLFFPAGPDELEPARRVCRTCPVAGPCLAEALGRAEIDGVWGGTTSSERRSMRAVWRGSSPRVPAPV
jgi:WhiB family redox-sensing transcriptional regulator